MAERYYIILQDFDNGGGLWASEDTFEEAKRVCKEDFPDRQTIIIKGVKF